MNSKSLSGESPVINKRVFIEHAMLIHNIDPSRFKTVTSARLDRLMGVCATLRRFTLATQARQCALNVHEQATMDILKNTMEERAEELGLTPIQTFGIYNEYERLIK